MAFFRISAFWLFIPALMMGGAISHAIENDSKSASESAIQRKASEKASLSKKGEKETISVEPVKETKSDKESIDSIPELKDPLYYDNTPQEKPKKPAEQLPYTGDNRIFYIIWTGLLSILVGHLLISRRISSNL